MMTNLCFHQRWNQHDPTIVIGKRACSWFFLSMKLPRDQNAFSHDERNKVGAKNDKMENKKACKCNLLFISKQTCPLPRVKGEAHIMKDSGCLTSSITRYYWKQLFTFVTLRCTKKLNKKESQRPYWPAIILFQNIYARCKNGSYNMNGFFGKKKRWKVYH